MREAQRKVFAEQEISLLADPSRRAAEDGLVDFQGAALGDQVVEEVVGYGLLDSKMATMAALHRIGGVRAEIAMISLGRGYFQNCIARNGRWTAGVHLFHWTLSRINEDPVLAASDLLGPLTLPLARLIELAKWHIIAFRLVLVCDIAQHAAMEGDPHVGNLASLARDAAEKTQPGSTDSLLRWLRRKSRHIHDAFPPERYDTLRRELHKEREAGVE